MAAIILTNLKGWLISLSGFILIEIVLEKTSGRRYSPQITWIIWGMVWILRYMGLSVYVSDYLAGMYQSEDWFHALVLFLDVGNIWIGMAVIAFLFKGSLRKNMVTVFLCEMFYTVWYSAPYLLRYLLSDHAGRSEGVMHMSSLHLLDLTLPIGTVLFFWVVLRFGNPFFERYSKWHSSHPVLVYAFLAVYLLVGAFSNVHYIISEGDISVTLYCSLVFLVFGYFYYDYIYSEREKEKRRHMELLYHEKAMKNYYRQSMEQSARISEYNREIQDSIRNLIQKAEQLSDSHETHSTADTSRDLTMLAAGYLDSLKEEYEKVSTSIFCEDYFIDHMLAAYNAYFRTLGVKTIFSFQDYRTPPGIATEDVETMLRFMISVVTEMFFMEGSEEMAEDIYNKPPISELHLFGGIVGRELLLTAKALRSGGSGPKNLNPGKSQMKRIRKLIKSMKADVSIDKQEDRTKVIVGIPV